MQAKLLPLNRKDKHVVIDTLSESKLDTEHSIILWELTASGDTAESTTD